MTVFGILLIIALVLAVVSLFVPQYPLLAVSLLLTIIALLTTGKPL